MSSLRERLQAVRVRLNEAERRVLDTILMEFETVASLTVSEVAKKSKTSEASVVRACKSLGFSGYHSLRLRVAEENGRNRKVTRAREPQDPNADAIASCIDSYGLLISKLSSMLPGQLLQNIGDMLAQANFILFTACGNSIPPALDASYRLSRLGLRTALPLDPSGQAALAETLTENDVIVAFSASGESIPIVETVKIAKDHGCSIITFTSMSKSPLTALGGLQVIIPSEREGLDLLAADALGSRILYMVVVSSIIEYLLSRYTSRFEQYIENSTISLSGAGRKL